MREIRFRGKIVRTGEWVCGGIVHQTDHYGETVDKYFIIDGTETQDYDIGYEYEVIPETVGQFTGLTDKNGKRIFEGDIVKVGVYYYCGCYPHTETRVLEVKIPDFYCWQKDGMEVIGNIHDNPELLEEV